MRLCLLAEASSVHTRRWARYFVERGDEVLVLSFRPGAIPGARVAVVAPPRLGRAGYLLGWPRARAVVRAFRPDLVHAHYATSYGLLGALVDQHPYVISSWGSDVAAGQAASPLWHRLLRFAYSRADAACATSHFLAEATRPFLAADRAITITPFGVDLARFPFRPPPRRPTVTVGAARFRLESIYGLHHLVAAFARLRDPAARLVVYGDGPERAALERQAGELGVAARVRFPGHVAHDAIPAALDALDVFAMPSIVPEAFGVAAVEASATGLPVVASRVGGLPEVVEDGRTGYLVAPGDEAALAARLDELIGDPARRARMGAEGRALVSRCYSWEENALKMAILYAQLTGGEKTRCLDDDDC